MKLFIYGHVSQSHPPRDNIRFLNSPHVRILQKFRALWRRNKTHENLSWQIYWEEAKIFCRVVKLFYSCWLNSVMYQNTRGDFLAPSSIFSGYDEITATCVFTSSPCFLLQWHVIHVKSPFFWQFLYGRSYRRKGWAV